MTSESCFYVCGIIIQRDAAVHVTLYYPPSKTFGISQELLFTRFPNTNHNSPRGDASSLLSSGFLGCLGEMLLDSFEQSIDMFAHVLCVEFSNNLFERGFVVAAITGNLSRSGRFQ